MPLFRGTAQWQLAIDAWYVMYVDDLAAHELDEIIDFTFIGGGNGSMSRNDILLHVVNHTTYHRGHVADMLHQVSVPIPTTDLPVFLRESAARRSALR